MRHALHRKRKTCSESTLLSRNADVDTSSEVLAIISGLGYTTTSSCVSSTTINQPHRAPQFKTSVCSYGHSSRSSTSDVSCSAPPGNNQRRI